jgi:hypothetical protein
LNTDKTSAGTFFAKVTAGRGTTPLEGVTVYVRDYTGDSEGNLLYTLKTDADGITPFVQLTAPDKASSLSPGSTTLAYSEYVVSAIKEGFNSVENVGVPIFDGIVSRQSIDMVPLTEDELLNGKTGTIVYNENGGYSNLSGNLTGEERI